MVIIVLAQPRHPLWSNNIVGISLNNSLLVRHESLPLLTYVVSECYWELLLMFHAEETGLEGRLEEACCLVATVV